MIVPGTSRLGGVIGWPVAHSLSPRLHGHWLAEYGIDGAYVPLPVRPFALGSALEGLRDAGFRGVNVTVPHKEAAYAVAGICDQAAGLLGAANLLLFGDGGFEARNSDAEGLAASLMAELGAKGLDGANVVLLGAGGAARAAILACASLKANAVCVLNRSPRRAAILVEALRPRINIALASGGLDEWPRVAADALLLIHATPAGMKGAGAAPAAAPLVDVAALPAAAAVCDLVYNPLETPLLTAARARGLAIIDGLGMLLHQAAPAFEALYGVRPRVTLALRAELESVLRDKP
ncbi:MAG TPA: hypothetical protein VGF97_17500 [Rhizomicrobium sp.]|jgi:shikimate dehydrogenase